MSETLRLCVTRGVYEQSAFNFVLRAVKVLCLLSEDIELLIGLRQISREIKIQDLSMKCHEHNIIERGIPNHQLLSFHSRRFNKSRKDRQAITSRIFVTEYLEVFKVDIRLSEP